MIFIKIRVLFMKQKIHVSHYEIENNIYLLRGKKDND